MKMTRIPLFKFVLLCVLVLASACSKNYYPCPDIHGGTEVVKAGSKEGLKKTETEQDENGRLTKKPYTHSGMKKKRH
jgi:hypothetical protein